jgi:hypothetical protein
VFVALRARTVVVVFSTGQLSKEITANDDNDKILSVVVLPLAICRPPFFAAWMVADKHWLVASPGGAA